MKALNQIYRSVTPYCEVWGRSLCRKGKLSGFFIGTALLLLLAFTFLVSCNFSDPTEPYIKPKPPIDFEPLPGNGIRAWCRHRAIVQYLVFGEYYPVEMVYGPVPDSTSYHLQTRAYIDGEWYWLKTAAVYVYIGEQDNFEPFYYNVPLDMALRWCGIDTSEQ